MQRKITTTAFIIILLFVILNTEIATETGPTGMVVDEDEKSVSFQECCSYTVDGVEKACYAVGRFGCESCSDSC